MEAITIAVLGLLVIAASTQLGPKLGVATPLLLVGIGVLASLPKVVPDITVDPEWILAGVLPPLLYAAGVCMPFTEFRREFRRISGLSVALVMISTLVLGFFLHAVIPDLPLPWAFALGAILSPTDPVAIGIVKQLGVSPRVIALLEGESLLNDATALVILRTAVAAGAAAAFSWADVAGRFAWSIAAAAVIGAVVGYTNLRIRSRVTNSTVNTVITFTVPFLASLPADALGASGLVAAVAAGLVTGIGAVKWLPPQHRLSDAQNWRTVELVLEGAVYLVMGLELLAVVHDMRAQSRDVLGAVWVAAGAMAVALVVRTAYVVPLLLGVRRQTQRASAVQPRLQKAIARLDDTGPIALTTAPIRVPILRRGGDETIEQRLRERFHRMDADISYMIGARLGWREGTVVVWSGMRGVATIAAAQALPLDAPLRSTLIFIAFVVAVGSLVIQGGTVQGLIRVVRPAARPTEAEDAAERARLESLLVDLVDDVPFEPGTTLSEARLVQLAAEREALLEIRKRGSFSSAVLERKLKELDAEQIHLEL